MIRETLLSDFPENEVSPRIQLLADGAAMNSLLLEGCRSVLIRGESVAPNVLKDYVLLSNAVSRDLQALEALARQARKGERAPTLEDYLEKIKRDNAIPIEKVKS